MARIKVEPRVMPKAVSEADFSKSFVCNWIAPTTDGKMYVCVYEKGDSKSERIIYDALCVSKIFALFSQGERLERIEVQVSKGKRMEKEGRPILDANGKERFFPSYEIFT